MDEGRRGGESTQRVVLWNKRPQFTNNISGTLFHPNNATTNPPDNRPHHPIIFPSYGNIAIPIRQNYNMVDVPQQGSQNSNQQPKEKNPPSNIYHINLDPPNQPQQQQQPPPQQSQVIGQTHKSITQSQITMEKLNERGPPPGSGYHIEIKHDDRKDIIRGVGPPPQSTQPHIPEGHVYNTTVRHIPMHTNVLTIPQSQAQQPNKPSGNITHREGYAHRMPNAPPPQQPQPGQIHYPRHRY